MRRSCLVAIHCLFLLSLSAGFAHAQDRAPSPWTVDFRYAPQWWQSSICLPDDWQKTLVGREGEILYDFGGGPYHDFRTQISLTPGEKAEWVRQELVASRVPIVVTHKRLRDVQWTEEAFAAPPTGDAVPTIEPPVKVDCLSDPARQANWAKPVDPCDSAFQNVAVGYAKAIEYRLTAERDARFTVVFGLCEGWHKVPGQRILDLKIEGRTVKTVDMVKEKGFNVPAVFAFEAKDLNGDGRIDIEVAAASNAVDKNTILNMLWVARGDAPDMEKLLQGRKLPPSVVRVACGEDPAASGSPRNDIVIVRLENTGKAEAAVSPQVVVESTMPIASDESEPAVAIGDATRVSCLMKGRWAAGEKGKWRLDLDPITLPPGGKRAFAVNIARGRNAAPLPLDLAQAEALRAAAEKYWLSVDLPYEHITVPDAGIQALLDSSIRNIYQAREIKQGLPAFQVGPTCYRGLWVVDGSFLLEAITYLNRAKETRSGIQYLLGFQRDDGGFMLINGHWKETGIVLWAVTRHARLTHDKEWLASVWPKLTRGFEFIRKMRATVTDAKAPNYRLIPAGFSDGGLGESAPEYTNIYWTLAGMRAAVDAARWLGKTEEADSWQKEYDDLYAAFRRAAERDTLADKAGNRYVPVLMGRKDIAPQRAQWAFLHAVFPGKIFAADDPLVAGNMAMLRANECQGLVLGTGWIADGIWNYFASFYAHAWLWTGDGAKAAETLYAFANHAAPTLDWREEQMPVGKGGNICGDMPHNWASAEFIRLVRHALVLERGDELHLFEALPAKWTRPGDEVKMHEALTEFGLISFSLSPAADGKTAELKLDPPRRNPPKKIVVHLQGWTPRTDTIEVSTEKPSATLIDFSAGK